MLVCGASLVRIANYVREEQKQPKDFVLAAIYMLDTRPELHLLYQKNNTSKVRGLILLWGEKSQTRIRVRFISPRLDIL